MMPVATQAEKLPPLINMGAAQYEVAGKKFNHVVMREGFWATDIKWPWTMDAPDPVLNVKWRGRRAFVKQMREFERHRNLRHLPYGERRPCRCCGKLIAKGDWQVSIHEMVWNWPDSYVHYITHHGAVPSENFYHLITLGLRVMKEYDAKNPPQ